MTKKEKHKNTIYKKEKIRITKNTKYEKLLNT